MNELFRALPALLKEFSGHAEVREAIIFGAWRKMAGESLREQAAPIRLDQNRLAVAVDNEMWKNHLEALSGQMIFKLNSALGSAEVTFIEFVVDEKAVEAENVKFGRPPIDEAESARIAAGEITPGLRESAGAIKNEELRERFLMAAGRCLARKKVLNERG
jgi:hypothetical protein